MKKSADDDFERYQALIDRLPPDHAALDASMLDGFLCGILLQPRPIAESEWLPMAVDIDRKPGPEGFPTELLNATARSRRACLADAIDRRDWFDPWVYEFGMGEDGPAAAALPWATGFLIAQAEFPELLDLDDSRLAEPLALILQYAEAGSLEDADEILAEIDSIEPAADMAELVEDLVRGVLLIADVIRPHAADRNSGSVAAPRTRAPARKSGVVSGAKPPARRAK